MDIVDFIPIGKENAIKRKRLTELCYRYGLIGEVKDKDRAMRKLINEAGQRVAIVNNSDGDGYFIPNKDSQEDKLSARAFAMQEMSKANEIRKRAELALAVYEE